MRLTAAVLCWLGLALAVRADEIKWKFTAGESFYTQETSEQKMEIQVMGQTIPVETKTTTICKFAVKEVKPDGGVVLTRSIETMKVETSQQAPGVDPEAMAKKMEGATFTLTLSPKLEVVKLEGYDDFIKRLSEADKASAEAIKLSMNEETIKRALDELFLFVPGKPVSKGDTWDRKSSLPMGPMGTLKAQVNYKYEGKEGPLDKISYDAKFTFEKPKEGAANPAMPFKVVKADLKSDKAKGTILFDSAKGRMAEHTSDVNLTMAMTVEAGGNEVDMNMQMEIKTTYKVLASKPTN